VLVKLASSRFATTSISKTAATEEKRIIVEERIATSIPLGY
jgi:hypothetical protein